jgi:Adenine-specific DNA methylase containing a Zn-ribbon
MMPKNTERALIESDAFGSLVPEIDENAAKEKGSGRPAYWEMIFWSTRKPLISARAFTAAALLPENYPLDKFKSMIRLSEKEKVPHKYQPIVNNEFKNFTILDPFAGFGSIPLEAKRLRVGKVIASELLPTAYVFLKAVLEYPKYGTKLLEDVKKYGQELIKSIEDDVKELYGEYSGFVGTWEVKCPHCGNYTPLVEQWWLLSLKKGKKKEEGEREEVKSGDFKRLVFMKPEVSGKQLRIKVIDLNKELNRKTIRAKMTKDRVIIDGKEYRVPEGNVSAKRSYAKCLFCNTTFPGKGDKWYVKEAIKDWNERYEKYLNGEISLEELQNAKARPTLLVKFKGEGKDLEFEETNKHDIERFWNLISQLKEVNLENIPIENVAPYGTISVTTWGMNRFYKFFNARQLIIFSQIITKLNELKGRIKGEEEYREAIITYLTLGFLNHIRYNCFLTSIDHNRKFTRDASSFRRFGFTWNWVEISPLANVIGSLPRSLDHVIEGLEYLIQTNTDSQIEIINSDVNELTLSDKVDVIVTDPPYADDVPYPEISDFYYVWLKRIIPFPYQTQWEEFVPRDIGVDKKRSEVFGDNVGSYEHFRNKLAQAFRKLAEILKDNGLLITFYNHTSPDAWVSLLYAGWYVSKFRITTAHAITTEDETRTTALTSTISLDKSIVLVWRKRAEGSKLIHEIRKEAISKVSDWVSNMLGTQKLKLSTDTYIEVLGKVLSVFTQYEKILGLRGEEIAAVEDLVTNYVFPTTAQAMIEGLSKGIGVRISDPYTVYYVLVKLLIPPPTRGVRKLDSNTLTFLNLSSGSLNAKDLQSKGVVRVEGKNDTIALVEPEQDKDIIAALEQLPEVKMALQGNYNFSNPVQVFHYLEYVSLKYSDRLKDEIEKLRERTRFVDEALAIAKVFARVLPDNDIEKEPSKRLSGDKVGIERWFNG